MVLMLCIHIVLPRKYAEKDIWKTSIVSSKVAIISKKNLRSLVNIQWSKYSRYTRYIYVYLP